MFFVGLDLGQSHDFTAVAILHRAELTGRWDPEVYAFRKMAVLRLRYLERMPLGTPYPEIVERMGQIARAPDVAGQCNLVADGTGVGRPVVDLLRKGGLGCRLLPVIITSGVTESIGKGYYHVPKVELITGLQVLLQRGELQIAAGLEHGPTLVREMGEMRARVTTSGHEQFGAWREGEHDDLVFAVALGCWGARKLYPNPTVGGVGWWQRSLDQGGGF